MRNRVWGSLSNFVFKAYVIDAMIMRYQKYDKRINICLAIVSSSSIAAWTIWQIVPQLWAGMIAITQVIQAVKPYFPYSKYIRTLNEKSKLLHDINRRFERLFTNYQTKQEKDEHTGFCNLLKGLCGMFRNPEAHQPKIFWDIDEQDALEILGLISYCHRRLDKAQKIR